MTVIDDPHAASVEHQQSVREFVAAARAVPAAQWEHTDDDTAWSPSQIAEHVRLTYEVVGAQFAGGTGLRVRTSWYMRALLRWRFLGGIMRDGVLPAGALAPREVRPAKGPFDMEPMLAAIERMAALAESTLMSRWTDPNCVMTHHVFGNLTPPRGMRLLTVHTRHHATQLTARGHRVSLHA